MSDKNRALCYICGFKYPENTIEYHKTHCLKKWKEEHSKILQSQLNPSLQKSSIFPLIKSKNQMDRERAVYESAKIEILSCSQCVPCIACQTESLGKKHEIIIRPPKLRRSPEINGNSTESHANTNSQKEILNKCSMCYVCGHDYANESLERHEIVCLNDWIYENNKLPPSKRRPVPIKPDLSTTSYPDFSFIKLRAKTESIRIFLQQNNLGSRSTNRAQSARVRQNLKELQREVEKAILIPCQKCGRRIIPDRFLAHIMSCTEPKKPATSHTDTRPFTQQEQPVVCYVCGRKYGKSSIEAHEQKCSERWKIQHIGKELPERPVTEVKEPTVEPSRSQLDLWRALYAPVDCSNCGVNFEPQSFVVHQQNCFFFGKKLMQQERKKSIGLLSSHETHRPLTPNGSMTSRSDSSKLYTSTNEYNLGMKEEREHWFCPNCTTDRVTVCASSNLYKNLYNLY